MSSNKEEALIKLYLRSDIRPPISVSWTNHFFPLSPIIYYLPLKAFKYYSLKLLFIYKLTKLWVIDDWMSFDLCLHNFYTYAMTICQSEIQSVTQWHNVSNRHFDIFAWISFLMNLVDLIIRHRSIKLSFFKNLIE